jgi:hypothetical protein
MELGAGPGTWEQGAGGRGLGQPGSRKKEAGSKPSAGKRDLGAKRGSREQREQGAGSREQGAGPARSRKQEARSRKQGTGSRKHGTEALARGPGNRKLGGGGWE